jgi:hypothetical protein
MILEQRFTATKTRPYRAAIVIGDLSIGLGRLEYRPGLVSALQTCWSPIYPRKLRLCSAAPGEETD